MTLVLAVVSPWAVHICSDIRLSYLDESGSLQIRDSSPKHVNLDYSSLQGVVTYTGIGSIGDVAPSDWLASCLASERLGASPTFEEVVNRIGRESDVWWRANRRSIQSLPKGWRRHSTLVVGVEGGVLRLGLVSNFQRLGGQDRTDPLATFSVTTGAGWKSRVVVLGATAAVSRADRHLLKAVAEGHLSSFGEDQKPKVIGVTARNVTISPEHTPPDQVRFSEASARIASSLAWLNRRIADEAEGSSVGPVISPGCIVTTVFGDGSTHRSQFGPGWAFAPSAGDWADPISLFLYLIRRRDRGEIAPEDVNQILSQWPRGDASIENSGGGP